MVRNEASSTTPVPERSSASRLPAESSLELHLHFGLYELMLDKDWKWKQRYPKDLPLRGSSDPLQYITETAENPYGDTSGLMVAIRNMLRYLTRRGN